MAQRDPDAAASTAAATGQGPPSIAPAPAAFPVPSAGRDASLGAQPGLNPVNLQTALQATTQAAPPSPISPTSPGGILPGGSPGGPGLAGPSPLEALQAPIPGETQPAPRALRPGLGGQLNPQIMQLILQALSAGQQPAAPAQSLGQILGQR